MASMVFSLYKKSCIIDLIIMKIANVLPKVNLTLKLSLLVIITVRNF